jgi:hypothetical protein
LRDANAAGQAPLVYDLPFRLHSICTSIRNAK